MSDDKEKEVEEIEEELLANAQREDKKSRKRPKKPVLEEEEEADEEVDDLVQEMRDAELNRYGRGPGVPVSRDRRRRDKMRQAQHGAKIQWAIPTVDRVETKNPRMGNTAGAINGRYRARRWKARARLGLECRRPILDDKGEDTGGTTSNLE